MNRLAGQQSPYLLQHAHNPVDWYPWGEEAFAKARAEDKPIFLSIGYSTCHWCHVMERESFENAAHRRAAQPRLRPHQGGSRRAPRRRPHLHDVRAGRHRQRRMAHVRLAHAGPAARFSAAPIFRPRTASASPASLRFSARSPRPGARAATRSRNPRAKSSTQLRSAAAVEPGPHLHRGSRPARQRLLHFPPHLRSAARRLRRRAQISARLRSSTFCCATTPAPATAKRSTWCCSPCAKWPRAACTTSSAAASIATRWTSAGSCRISKKCSTTRRSSPSPTWKRFRSPATRSTPGPRAAFSITCCAT